MTKTNGMKIETPATELSTVSDKEETVTTKDASEPVGDVQDIDDILNSLKALLSTVEKLQKVRQEVGDIKPLIGRMLDGEIVGGEELDQLKSGVGSLSRLVRAYSDHQTALVKAQPARDLLDRVLKEGYAG
jgi:regulator of replication initiation timing